MKHSRIPNHLRCQISLLLYPLTLVSIVSIMHHHSRWLVGLSWMKWRIDLPLLQSVKLGGGAFGSTKSFAMSNLTSLQSIEFGGGCFYWASSFSLIGIIEWMKWEIDLPLLKAVKLGNGAFRYTGSFAMSNLPSLQSIEFGNECFNSASSFLLIGIIDWMKWEIDLPLLQSVRLGGSAFQYVYSIVFESDGMDGLMIQICLNYNPFNLKDMLFLVMVVMIERRLAIDLTTTRTHWQCEVRLNELMNE